MYLIFSAIIILAIELILFKHFEDKFKVAGFIPKIWYIKIYGYYCASYYQSKQNSIFYILNFYNVFNFQY